MAGLSSLQMSKTRDIYYAVFNLFLNADLLCFFKITIQLFCNTHLFS